MIYYLQKPTKGSSNRQKYSDDIYFGYHSMFFGGVPQPQEMKPNTNKALHKGSFLRLWQNEDFVEKAILGIQGIYFK